MSEVNELDYVEQLLADFGLEPNDKIADLLEALDEDDEGNDLDGA